MILLNQPVSREQSHRLQCSPSNLCLLLEQAEDGSQGQAVQLSTEAQSTAKSMLPKGAAATLVDSALGALKHGTKDGKSLVQL